MFMLIKITKIRTLYDVDDKRICRVNISVINVFLWHSNKNNCNPTIILFPCKAIAIINRYWSVRYFCQECSRPITGDAYGRPYADNALKSRPLCIRMQTSYIPCSYMYYAGSYLNLVVPRWIILAMWSPTQYGKYTSICQAFHYRRKLRFYEYYLLGSWH